VTDLHQPAFAPVTNRYFLPNITERTSYGLREMNPYSKMFEERIIFMGMPIDDTVANDIMAQSFTAMTAIYDTMQYIQPTVRTVCLGQAASAAAVLLAAGNPGSRLALPNSRIIIHQPATEGGYGQSSDIEIQAREILRMRSQLEDMLARHSNRTVEQVRKDIDRDKILTADEAKEYGLVDDVIGSRKKTLVASGKAS